MRGRHPSGPEFVQKLAGSEQARQRAQVLLETIAGSCRVGEALERLEICEQRFDQIRIEALQALVTALEPGVPGRPGQQPAEAELEVQRLQEEKTRLEAELQAALVRAELALTLPQANGAEAKKAARSPGRMQ